MSAAILFETAGIAEHHLGVTAEAYLPLSPAKLIVATAVQWARERGTRILHLGGGLGGNEDSLFHFKAGFTPLRAPFYTLRLVLDDARHKRLLHACGADPADLFFPAYRGPGVPERK